MKDDNGPLVFLPAPIAKAGCELVTALVKRKGERGWQSYQDNEDGEFTELYDILRRYDLIGPNQ